MIELGLRESGLRDVNRLLERLIRLPGRLLARAAERARRELLARLPRRTGRLAESLGIKWLGNTVMVGLGAFYARFLELGTRPHEILPRKAKALVFTVRGRLVFARRVLHPGLRPRFMARSAADALADSLHELAREEWEDAVG